MTDSEIKECRIIMDSICDNMGIIAQYLRTDTGRKLTRLSRAVQLYQQRQQLGKLREDIGQFIFDDVNPPAPDNAFYKFSRN